MSSSWRCCRRAVCRVQLVVFGLGEQGQGFARVMYRRDHLRYIAGPGGQLVRWAGGIVRLLAGVQVGSV
jgi:hypothetical protein